VCFKFDLLKFNGIWGGYGGVRVEEDFRILVKYFSANSYSEVSFGVQFKPAPCNHRMGALMLLGWVKQFFITLNK
jgi:hypothetical protein